ncbi:hypothetical protein ACTQ6A_14165 [Lachnospiraceae bacterium LCP25S3_G4]
MERLTMESEKGGVALAFDLDVVCNKSEMLKLLCVFKKLKQYEDTELEPEKLKEIDKLYLAKCEEVNRLKAELGQSLKLPCNVGDTVYAYCSAFGILEYYVDEINVCIETTVFLCSAYSEQCGEYQSECLDEIEPCIADFGKTVFLTLEEAQAKLEERKGE